MEVRDETKPVRPGVRRPGPATKVGERGDAATTRDASAREHDVSLDYVEERMHDEVARLVGAPHHLARSET